MGQSSKSPFAIERELAGGRGDVYRHHLSDDAVLLVPGMTLDRDAAVDAMDASPGWDSFRFEDQSEARLSAGVVLLRYRFIGRRGDSEYEAMLTSVYVRDEGNDWKLVHHQQTPVERETQE